MALQVITFQHISKIFDVTDALGLNREWVEILLSSENPGAVRRLTNGKLEIVVDAEQPFDQWLISLPDLIQHTQVS